MKIILAGSSDLGDLGSDKKRSAKAAGSYWRADCIFRETIELSDLKTN